MAVLSQRRLEAHLATLRRNIAAAAERCGRRPDEVEIMAVTKTVPAESVRDALRAGIGLFGENKVQEAEAKYAALAGETDARGDELRLHLIGHLQRNKAARAVRLFSCVQSVDKPETAERLQQVCERDDRRLDILLELNTSGEETKSGFRSPDALRAGLERILGLDRLRVRGLMTVGPWTRDEARIRGAFSALRELFDAMRGEGLAWDTLSMGMSDDYEIAVEEGSTLVRIGTAIFGRRPPPASEA